MSFLGRLVMRSAVCAVAVVVVAGLPSSSVAQTGAFTDSRDGKTYKTVKIGKQTWMARNLDYAPDSGKPWSFTAQNLEDVPDSGKSWCYNDSASYCKKYGRLYDWETAKAVCPDGWKLPDTSDWDMLGTGQELKSKRGWGGRGNGIDKYGFSALPGGNFDASTNRFDDVEYSGYWWTASEEEDSKYHEGEAISDMMCSIFSFESLYSGHVRYTIRGHKKGNGLSVRCVQDVKK
jgi:uncharacterized protein (TIGR02145 family)